MFSDVRNTCKQFKHKIQVVHGWLHKLLVRAEDMYAA